MNEDEITKLKLMICHLDLSVETKEKLYNQAHKIRNQLQQKENKEKEIREYIRKASYFQGNKVLNEKDILEILDKENI